MKSIFDTKVAIIKILNSASAMIPGDTSANSDELVFGVARHITDMLHDYMISCNVTEQDLESDYLKNKVKLVRGIID